MSPAFSPKRKVGHSRLSSLRTWQFSEDGSAVMNNASADLKAYTNGRIYTGVAEAPWADSMVVRDGRIVAVGSAEQVLASCENIETVDLAGRMVMPGLHDAHIHLLASGLKFQFECRLTENAGPDQIVTDLCNCPKCRTPALSDWIIAGEFNPNVFPEGTLDRAFLDEAFPDKPVFMFDYTIHHALVNSKALELAGIDANTVDPKGGKIVRRANSNEPTGELVERATWAVRRVIPEYDHSVYHDAMVWAMETSSRFGITSVQEASATLAELKVLNELDAAGKLPMHVTAHLVWQEESFGGGVSSEEQERLIAQRRDFSSAHVYTDFVKCWIDGAPLPPHFTEAPLEDGQIDYSRIQISEEDLTAALISYDRQGVMLKMHCAGEGAIRVALNAIANMRAAEGASNRPQEIAHCTFIHPDDRPRFAELNVVAEFSPAIWHIRTPEFAVLDSGYTFATMENLGTHMTIGSDWIITENPNLFPALQGMLERGSESVTLESALYMMTLAGAKAVGLDDRTGSLEVGKSADFIVLDRNLFEIPVSEINQTAVLQTVFEGRTVYRSNVLGEN